MLYILRGKPNLEEPGIMRKNNKANHKIVFYTGILRAFRATSIANLYEICQVFPVVLLSEKLDKETEEILKNKTLFPKLEEIVPVNLFKMKKNLFFKNIHVYKLAKDIIKKHRPVMVIMPSDVCLFDFYLMRFAKKIKAINIVLNSDLRLSIAREMSLRTDLTHTYFGLPLFLPFRLRFLLIQIRKYLGYLLHNWLLPLSVGQVPFFGKSSRILYSMSGSRADYRIVCSKQDYNLSLKEGIPERKLALLEHPLKRENTKRFFDEAYLLNLENKDRSKTKNLILLYPEEPYGFRRGDLALISEEEIQKSRIKIVNLIVDTLKDWRIFIKPHPATPKADELKKIFEAISPFITFINPTDPVDKYIEMSDIITGLPPASSALFTATLQCSHKPILSLDLDQEIFGDCYKDFDGIEYIDNEKRLIHILRLIRDGKYTKERKTEPKLQGFGDTVQVLDFLLSAKNKL